MRIFLFFFYFVFELKAQNSSFLKLNSVSIPQTLQNLSGSIPKDILITDDHVIWIASEQGVEIFSLKDQIHQKMSLSNIEIEKIINLPSKNIVAVNSKEFFLIQKDPLNIKKFSLEKSYPTIGLQITQDESVKWIRLDGIYSFNKNSDSLAFQEKKFPDEIKKVILDEKSQNMMCMSKEQVFFQNQKDQWKQILDRKTEVLDIAKLNNDQWLIAFPYQLLILSSSGEISQTIPIVSQRVLKNSFLSNLFHSYLFQDGVLEIKDLEKSKTYFLSHKNFKSDKKITIHLPWIVFSGDKTFEVFQTEEIKSNQLTKQTSVF